MNNKKYDIFSAWSSQASEVQKIALPYLAVTGHRREAVDFVVETGATVIVSPKTMAEFIERFPGQIPGASVHACALLVEGGGERFCIGGGSAEVWDIVRRRKLDVVAVLYAGDERNTANAVAEAYNAPEK